VVHAIHEYQRPVPGLRRAAGEPSAVRRRRKADRVT
jgi:hypothetical protein